jgi:hypothetical protein
MRRLDRDKSLDDTIDCALKYAVDEASAAQTWWICKNIYSIRQGKQSEIDEKFWKKFGIKNKPPL